MPEETPATPIAELMRPTEKKRVFPTKAVLLIVIIAAVGVAAFFIISPSLVQLKNCGSDSACFNATGAECVPSSFSYEADAAGAHFKQLLEIRGGTREACTLLIKIDDISGTSAMVPQTFVGKEATCVFPTNETALFLEKINALDFETINASCEGTLKDAYAAWSENLQFPTNSS